MVHDFLSSEGLEERLVDGCMEKIFRIAELLEKIRMHMFGWKQKIYRCK